MTSKAEMRAELELLCAGKPVTKCPTGKRGMKMTDAQWTEFRKLAKDDPMRAEMLADAGVHADTSELAAAAAQGDLAHAISA